MEPTRRLVLVRHAQAESVAPSDAERPLTERGRADAAALGAWLATAGIEADLALVSDAVRTRETWAEVSGAAGWDAEADFSGGIYATDDQGLLDLLQETPDDAGTVVVVGHNPTIGMVVQLLDDGDSTVAGPESGSFPTATAAVFDIEGEWVDLGPLGGRLTHFHVARA